MIHRLGPAAERSAGVASIDIEMAWHDLGGLLRRWHGLSDADSAALGDMRHLAGEAAALWHRRLARQGSDRPRPRLDAHPAA